MLLVAYNRELVALLLRKLYSSDTPFIYLGEESDSGIYHQIIKTRPWALITKPVRWADLQIAIENIIFRHPSDDGLTEEYNLQKVQLEKKSELERRWHTLLNNLPGLAYQCLDDEQWTMWFLSQGCRELTGYEPSEIVLNKKISFQELIHPDDRIVVRNTVVKSSHKQFELTYRIRTKKGQEKWVLERGIKTDLQILKSAIYNILDNAVKFSDKGKVELGGHRVNGSKLLLFVKDGGIGIPKELHDSVFGKFRKIENKEIVHRARVHM